MLSLSIGAKTEIYEVEAIEHAASQLDAQTQSGASLLRVYNRMLQAGGERYVSKPASSEALEPLREQCPNFAEVLDDLSKYVELALFGSGTLSFMPVLLAGDPGVGKTHFAKSLSKVLGVPYRFVSMGTLTAGWVLSGSAPTWSGARHGKVAEALIDEEFANPLFVLDEVDKSGGDARYDPYGALLQLLEPETSRHFKDEFLDIPVNASAILWVATANDLSRIPDYILSRMAVYEVPAPTPEQAAVIAQNVYSHLLRENGWAFQPTLDAPVLELLASVPPRAMKKRLIDAMGAARLVKRDYLRAEDVRRMEAGTARRGMGFTARL